MDTDWRSGFLFVGNQLALDFINTRPLVGGAPTELLPDGAALARWLKAAGLVNEHDSVRLARKWSSPQFTVALQGLRELRESLRRVVFQIEAGENPTATFIKDINRLLLRHPPVDQVVNAGSVLERKRHFAPEIPEDALAPLVDAMADLVTKAARLRIRKCPNCVLHFCDISKKGTRVWCSMRLCGNRAKVAAWAGRRRVERKTP